MSFKKKRVYLQSNNLNILITNQKNGRFCLPIEKIRYEFFSMLFLSNWFIEGRIALSLYDEKHEARHPFFLNKKNNLLPHTHTHDAQLPA